MGASDDRPALEAGSRVVRQVERGETRFIVRAGTSGRYLRVGEAEAAILDLLDGERDVGQVRTSYIARRRENIALDEIASFIGRMRSMGVVRPTVEAQNLMLVEKARQRRQERRFTGSVGSLLFLRRKLFDPDRLLTAMVGPLGFFFTRGFVIFGAVLVAIAAGILVARWPEVAAGVRNLGLVLTGSHLSLLTVWVTAIVVVFIHEFGHGLACKHYGGEVHDMGVLLLFFQPCFYCNVNDAWTFQSRAARLWVTAAGGVIETVLGSACVIVWAVTEPGSAVHEISRLVFTMSLSMTLLFNMNPLIKLDGYYLLADFLGIDNLRDRSMQQLRWFVRSVLFRLPAERATADPREGRILLIYGAASTVYMALLLGTILWVLWGALTGGGGAGPLTLLVLGVLAWMLLRQPLRFVGGAMAETVKAIRSSAKARRLALAAGGALALAAVIAALVPCAAVSAAACDVVPAKVVEVCAGPAGRLVDVAVRDGSRVGAGATLFRVEAPEEEAAARVAREAAERLRRAALRRAAEGDAAGARALEGDAEAAASRYREAEVRLARAVATSPIPGVVLGEAAGAIEGRTVGAGRPVLRVADLAMLRAHAALPAREVGRVRVGMPAEVRLHALPGERIEGRVVAVGGRPVEPAAGGGGAPARTERRWMVEVEIPNPGGRALPGMTGEVRILRGSTTLAGAALDAIRSTVRSDVLR